MDDNNICMRYTLGRLEKIVTQTHLMEFMDEIRGNIRINEDWLDANPPTLPEQVSVDPDDFNVIAAIDRIKVDYVERALARSKNVSEASKLLGLKNYQTLQNWIEKLGIDYA